MTIYGVVAADSAHGHAPPQRVGKRRGERLSARASAADSTVGRGRSGRSLSSRRGRAAKPSSRKTSRTTVALSAVPCSCHRLTNANAAVASLQPPDVVQAPPRRCAPRRPTARRWSSPSAREDGVGICPASCCSQRVLVVRPDVDDGLGARVVAEEQSEASSDLRPAPVPVACSERFRLSVLSSRGVFGDGLEHRSGERIEELGVRTAGALLRAIARADEFTQLFAEVFVEEQPPPVPLHYRSTSPMISSSSGALCWAASSRASARSSGMSSTLRPASMSLPSRSR